MAVGTRASIDAADLERLVKAVEPAAFLVPPRILRRVIRADRKLVGIGLDVPHRKSYVIGRDAFRPLVEKEELGLKPDGNLPAVAVLLERPEAEWLAQTGREEVLLRYWRLLFHAHVHLALERRLSERKVSDAALRQRIHRIGQTEFNEIRAVLRQEHLLLPPRDDRTAYVEFAAVYLELRHFAPPLLARYFPAIQSLETIDAVLADDVDAARLFAGTRLPGAPEPKTEATVGAANVSEPSGAPLPDVRAPAPTPEEQRRLTEEAEQAAEAGNDVRAAILRTRAAATGSDLDRLARRLQAALGQGTDAAGRWREALAPLQEPASHGAWPAEARLLYDLQKVCIDRERAVYSVDLVEWALAFGQRPLKRLLVNQPDVLALKHLRGAARRLRAARLSDDDRARLAALIAAAVHEGEHRLRAKLQPVVAGALEQVGMTPRNFPERVALARLTEELLDRVVETGHLNMGHLRDAVSRNNLKLPDLSGPVELLRGNRLLRANGRFAEVLDGVYHRGEIYLRWLQRFSLLNSGTHLGRLLTLYLALPFGGAFLALFGLYHMIADFTGVHLHALASPVAVGLFGVFLFLLLHVPPFRRAVVRGLAAAGRGARALAGLPAAFLGLPPVRRLLRSRGFRFAYHYVLKPLPFALLVWLVLRLRGAPPEPAVWGAAVAFLAALLIFNSRLTRDLEEAVTDWLALSWRRLLAEVLPGMVRLLLDVFKGLLEAVDRVLYSVDEWLRFRAGDSRLSLVLKAVLGLFWSAVTYVVRFAVNLLIEPQVNPIKHFPVVTVSHKLLLPLLPTLARVLEVTMEPGVAWAAATVIIAGVPGIFGFLVWELKENWRLYEANRPDESRPVAIGHHGETMARLLRPGFHSGTLPKLFARLRRAERRALRTGDRRAARKQREALHEVEEAVRRFVERDLLAVLDRSKSWGGALVECGEVALGSNRVRIELRCPGLSDAGLRIAFEEQSGWLVAGVAEPGWLGRMSAEQRRALRAALAGLYKYAGVDLLREQVEAALGGASYDIADEGLVVWTGPRGETEAVYDLRAEGELTPRVIAGNATAPLPMLSAAPLLYRKVPLPWGLWVDVWEQDQAGKGIPETFLDGVRLLPQGG
jgi:hypothetical protein